MGGLGCDNMTAVLVCLLQEDTPEAYVTRCSRKPAESAAGDATNMDSETFITPQPSPVKIESSEVAFVCYIFFCSEVVVERQTGICC